MKHAVSNREHFGAPWGTALKIVTALATFILAGVAVAIQLAPGVPTWTRWLATTSILTTLFGCAAFTVRAYEFSRGELRVLRLFWTTRIVLDGLRTVEADPAATRRSVRLFGNGGLFSFSGWFRNKTLGTYRMCATDPRKAVVLRFPDRVWVVSPDRTAEFVGVVREKAGLR